MAYHINEELSDLDFLVLEGKQLAIRVKKGIGGSSQEIYIIKSGEPVTPSDLNVFSASRTLDEIKKVVGNGAFLPANKNADGTYTVDVSCVTFTGNLVSEKEISAYGIPSEGGEGGSGGGSIYIIKVGETAQPTDENVFSASRTLEEIKNVKVDLSEYAKTSQIPTDNSQLSNGAGYITSDDLFLYPTRQEVWLTSDFDINDYATQIWVRQQNYLTEHQSLEGYATEQWVLGRGFITDIPSEYVTESELTLKAFATQTWVRQQNYLTEHQPLDGYATEQWVLSKNYLTRHQDISGKVDKVDGKGLSTNDYTTAEKNKLQGIEEGANRYIHPSTHPATMIEEDTKHRFVTDAEKDKWNDWNNWFEIENIGGKRVIKAKADFYSVGEVSAYGSGQSSSTETVYKLAVDYGFIIVDDNDNYKPTRIYASLVKYDAKGPEEIKGLIPDGYEVWYSVDGAAEQQLNNFYYSIYVGSAHDNVIVKLYKGTGSSRTEVDAITIFVLTQSQSGVDPTELWSLMGSSTTEQINKTHLTTALKGYLTEIPQAGYSKLGGIKTNYTASGKYYAVKVDSDGNAFVYVPWTDTDTDTNYYLSSVTGNGNGIVTFYRSGTTSFTHDFSHTHSEYAKTDGSNASGTWDIDITGNAATAQNISSYAPILAVGAEPNEIKVCNNANGSLGGSYKSITKAIDFRWYNSHYQIGNIRDSGAGSLGFGISEGNSNLLFSTCGEKSIFYNNVGVGTESPTEKLEVNGNVKATSFIGYLNGNASTATVLRTPRTIWGQSFDGSQNITGEITTTVGIANKWSDTFQDEFNASRPWYGISFPKEGSNNKTYIASYWGINFKVGSTGKYYFETGNVGIGISNPTEKLEVDGDIKTKGIKSDGGINISSGGNNGIGFLINGNASTGLAYSNNTLRPYSANTTLNLGADDSRFKNLYIKDNANIGNDVYITAKSFEHNIFMGNQDGVGANKPSIIWASNGNTSIGYGSSWTGGGTKTPVLNVRSNGYVGIGTASPTHKLQVEGNMYASGDLISQKANMGSLAGACIKLQSNFQGTIWEAGIYADYFGSNNICSKEGFQHGLMFKSGREAPYGDFIFVSQDGTPEARISKTSGHYFYGNILATGEITAYSDARLKADVKPLENRGYIEPKTYVKDGKESIGFLAQDVQKLYPELVKEDNSKEKYLSLNYAQMTAVLEAQIIEQKKEIDELRKMIVELKGMIR